MFSLRTPTPSAQSQRNQCWSADTMCLWANATRMLLLCPFLCSMQENIFAAHSPHQV